MRDGWLLFWSGFDFDQPARVAGFFVALVVAMVIGQAVVDMARWAVARFVDED